MNKFTATKILLGLLAIASICMIYVTMHHAFFGDQSLLGAGYNPVTAYQTRLTSYISTSASTFPVASTKDVAGNQISISNITVSSTGRVYFDLEPGTAREEIAYCTGVTSLSWTGCVRGLSFQGSSESSSSTLSKAHNAGAVLVMSDVGQFFNQYVGTSGDQTIFNRKTFDEIPRVTSTTALPISNDQLVTKYYADTVVSTGFTAANIGTNYGLTPLGTSPEKVGVTLSTTSSGLYFDTTWGANYPLSIQVSSTGGLMVNGVGRLIIDTSDAQTWTGNQLFGGTTLLQGNATATANFAVTTTPSTVYDAVNFNAETRSVATGTAAMTIAAGQAIYITSTSTLALTNANVTSAAYPFVGIALTAGSSGQTIQYARIGGIADIGLSGLTANTSYYLSNTGGSLATTPGTVPVRVGLALTASTLQVLRPGFRSVSSGTIFVTCSTNSVAISPGWQPTSADFLCADSFANLSANNTSTGKWVMNSDGTSSTWSNQAGIGKSCRYIGSGSTFIITVSTTQTGMNATCTGAAGVSASPIYYALYHDEQ